MKLVKEYLFELNFTRSNNPLENLNIGIIQVIFDKTSGEWGKDDKCAYSYDRCPKNWKDIIKWLIKEGFTPMETEEILRSKLMRWAGDYVNKDENVTLSDFKEYVSDFKNYRTQYKNALDKFIKVYIDKDRKYYLDQTGFNENVNEDSVGGVSSPMSTLNNTPGMGNAVPPSQSTNGIGSGDKWSNNIGTYTQKGKIKKRNKKKIEEDNVNPYDKVSLLIAKKLKVPIYFKKSKNQGINQKKIKEQYNIITLDNYIKLF